MNRNDVIGAVGRRGLLEDEPTRIRYTRGDIDAVFYFNEEGELQTASKIDYSTYTCSMMKKDFTKKSVKKFLQN